MIATTTMIRTATAGRHLSRRAERSIRSRGAGYSTDRKVQTPLQSQKTDKVAPSLLRPEAESSRIQTPVQSQAAADLSLQSGQRPSQQLNLPQHPARAGPSRATPMFVLVAGLLAVLPAYYLYYDYRKEHMDKKWAGMLKDAEQKRA